MTPSLITSVARALVVSACLATAGCTVGPRSSEPTPGPVASAVPPAIPSPSPATSTAIIERPSPMPPASPSEPASASPRPSGIKPGTVVETLVPDVRVRSRPRVVDSDRLEPVLPAATKLYVLDGPVAGSGYEWFWVAQLSSTELPDGWVAAGGRDGEAWLGPSRYACPARPDDFRSLVALPRGVGLLCFPRVPITFDARLYACSCDPTPGSDRIAPNWLFPIGQGPFLVDPAAVRLPDSDSTGRRPSALELLPDPAGRIPANLPVGNYLEDDDWSLPRVVRVTGMYDHPQALRCHWDSHDPVPADRLPFDPAVGVCRLEFAVTRIVVP